VRLVKGGHGEGDWLVDALVDGAGRELARWEHPRVPSVHTHGTGCTLASAIAAGLAKGEGLIAACDAGIAYVQAEIRRSSGGLGRGRGPLWQVGWTPD
jgi:hydroxymethylpyrimidine/phosphomethylpyrimidine kinase